MLKSGDKFKSFEEFDAKLKQYEKTVLCNFWRRDCRTLDSHGRKFPNSVAARARKSLRYYFFRLACSLGGRRFISKSTGKKKQPSLDRTDCTAGMHVKLSSCGRFLVLAELNEVHNHPLSDSLVKVLTEEEIKQEVPEDESKLLEDTGFVTLKELSNTETEFSEFVDVLKNRYNCDVNILCDEEDNVLCLFFQDPEMKIAFDAYPEMIFVEGTYCLHENGPAMYAIMGEDSEGNGTVVAVGILLNENEEVMDWFVTQFREFNPNSAEIKTVATDRDGRMNSILQKQFPDASLEIALFHTLNKFKVEINRKNLGLNGRNMETVRRFFNKVVLASSEEDFEQACANMRAGVPNTVMDYYEKIWHPIKDLWVLYLTSNYKFAANETCNRLETVSAKIKSVILGFTNLEEFIIQFFSCVDSIRVNSISAHFQKISTKMISEYSAADYKTYLTNYAFLKVQQQILGMQECADFEFNKSEKYLVSTPEGPKEVTANSCQCLFRTSMGLPCRHILKFRSIHDLPLYSEDLYTKRWTRTYFESHHPFFNVEEKKMEDEQLSECSNEEEAMISDEKFKLMYDECVKLSNICSEASTEVFYKRFDFLKNLVEKWSNFEDEDEVSDGETENDDDDSIGEYILEVADDDHDENNVEMHIDNSEDDVEDAEVEYEYADSENYDSESAQYAVKRKKLG